MPLLRAVSELAELAAVTVGSLTVPIRALSKTTGCTLVAQDTAPILVVAPTFFSAEELASLLSKSVTEAPVSMRKPPRLPWTLTSAMTLTPPGGEVRGDGKRLAAGRRGMPQRHRGVLEIYGHRAVQVGQVRAEQAGDGYPTNFFAGQFGSLRGNQAARPRLGRPPTSRPRGGGPPVYAAASQAPLAVIGAAERRAGPKTRVSSCGAAAAPPILVWPRLS